MTSWRPLRSPIGSLSSRARRGTIKTVRECKIPRPRDVFHIHESPGFAEVYDSIWNDLRGELKLEHARHEGPHE